MASSHDFRIKKLRPRKDQPNMVWIVYKMTDEWYIEWKQVTTSDNKCYNEWQL